MTCNVNNRICFIGQFHNCAHDSMILEILCWKCLAAQINRMLVNLLFSTFQDGLVDQLYDLILEYFHSQASSISFPELALPTIIQVKQLVQ